jgi:hypothetical protein
MLYHKMSLNPSFASCDAAAPDAKVSVSGSITGTVNVSFGSRGPSAKNSFTYQSNGYTMNSSGYLANPSRSAQIAANNAGALTRAEAARMGLPLGGRR